MNSHAKKITVKLSISHRKKKNSRNGSICNIKELQRGHSKYDFFLFDKSFKIKYWKNQVILDKINQQIQFITKLHQWKHTSSVLESVDNFENKEQLSFHKTF